MGLFFFSYQVLILYTQSVIPWTPQIKSLFPTYIYFRLHKISSSVSSLVKKFSVSLVIEKILHKGYFSSPLYTKMCNPYPFGPVKTFFAYDFRT